jgi:hypothetical protein
MPVSSALRAVGTLSPLARRGRSVASMAVVVIAGQRGPDQAAVSKAFTFLDTFGWEAFRCFFHASPA